MGKGGSVNQAADGKHPRMKKKKMRWPLVLIWLIPVLTAAGAGIYVYEYLQERGTLITISFDDGSGLREGETIVSHRGVEIGKISELQLSEDQKQVMVKVRLHRTADAFAKKGALFWVVRPEISTASISGLTTITSGPYIDSAPGEGESAEEFTGLEKAPSAMGAGLHVMLHTVRLNRLQAESPVYYRGIQVGVIQDVQLSQAADGVDVQLFIQERYSQLVRTNSQFWVISGFDVKGGLFSGVQVKLDSLRSLLAGGITFASPEEGMGAAAKEGAEFALYDEPKKEWLDWSPKIAIPPGDLPPQNGPPSLPHPADAVRSAVK